MSLPTNEQMVEYSGDIDDYLFEFCEKTELSFLEMSAIVLARLSHIAKDIGEHKEFIRLMNLAEYAIENLKIDEQPPSNLH